MPTISQFFSLGSNGSNSSKNRQGFSPISRKSTSATPSSSEIGRFHLRSKSDSDSVRPDYAVRRSSIGCISNGSSSNRNSHNIPHSRFSTRTSAYHRNCVGHGHGSGGHDAPQPEPYEDRYERYRQTYLTTSPERELDTLNAAIVNVRKWLKKKHQCLLTLQQSPQALANQAHKSPKSPKGTPHLQRKSTNGKEDHPSDSSKQDDESKKALLEKLVLEAGHQQEAVNVLLDRGHRYLAQRACITLEVDLENLTFLWGSYTKQLFSLQDRSDSDLGNDLDRSKHLVLELRDQSANASGHPSDASRKYQNGDLSDVKKELDFSDLGSQGEEGKENIQHSTPVKGKKSAAKSGSCSLNISDSSDDQKNISLSRDSENRDQLNLKPEILFEGSIIDTVESPPFHLAKKKRDSSFAKESDKCSTAQLSTPAKPGTIFATQEKKKKLPSPLLSRSSRQRVPFPTDASSVRKPRGSQEKITATASTAKPEAATSTGTKSRTSPGQSRRVLPPTPAEKHKAAKKTETSPATKAGPTKVENPKQKELELGSKEEQSSCQELKSSSEVKSQEEGSKSPTAEGNKSPLPKSGRARVLSATSWPAETTNGWLKVPGDGIFSSSTPRRRSAQLRLFSGSSCSSDKDSPPISSLTANLSQEVVSGRDICPTQRSPSKRASQSEAGVSNGQGLLEKGSNDIHNEIQQHCQQQAGAEGGVEQNASAAPESGLHLQLRLTASEEDLKMEIEEALKEIHNGSLVASATSADVDLMELDSGPLAHKASTPTRTTPTRTTPTKDLSKSPDMDLLRLDDLDFPTGPKRRRLNTDTLSSCSGSPYISGDSSLTCTPTESPAGTLRKGELRQRYKKDELWKAIESNYRYLMDKEIIETCQSTGSTMNGEEDEVPNVSFAEFLKQYQELIDWLNQAQRNTQRTVNSLSEKYLNQTYHEEMLEKSPRREFLNKYAVQLLLRYPNLGDQVNLRLQRLNSQWQVVEAAVAPHRSQLDTQNMLKDLECDLQALRRWLNTTESRLLPLTIRADWTDEELEERLKQHQILQQDIESHSRIVSAVLKLSERLDHARNTSAPCSRREAEEAESLQIVALNLERRWHGIWLQSLEWQCRLEEAINRRKGLYGSSFNFSSFNLPTLDESYFSDHQGPSGDDVDIKTNGSVTTSSNGSLIELSDDSLLFIGTRTSDNQVAANSPEQYSPGNKPGIQKLPGWPIPSPKLTIFLDRSSGDSANISECESKMGDSPRCSAEESLIHDERSNCSLNLSSDGESGGGREGRPVIVKALSEPKDVGYSSESQSNDETESMQQQIALECRYAGIIEVASDSPLGEKMAIPLPGVRPDYYCMTLVDLDSTDRTNTTTDDGGNTTDDRENHQSALEKKSLVVGERNKVNEVRLNGLSSALNNMDNHLDEKKVEKAASHRGSHEDIDVKSWLEFSSDEADKLDVMPGAKAAELPLPSSLVLGSESDSATESHEKIRYLIDHAEELVKTSPPRSVQPPGSPKRKVSPSKQTQTTTTETSSVDSSCDASSENSEESGAEEFSTATDDADETLFNSVINLDSAALDCKTREDVPSFVSASSASLVDHARLRKQTGPRGYKRDRPWSVVGLQDYNKADFHPLSSSESAIDDRLLHPQTDTDSSSSNLPSQAATFPRRGRGRGYQRTVSAGESGSTVRAVAKRKLKYSSSSSATDSQTSRSSATKVAISTEDEDDKTFVYESVEQLRGTENPARLAETESETTDDYVTASMDEMMTSADEDPHNSSSFSENAWDNYQMIYPTASEDATEDVLHWEPVDDMEFDDDFNFNFNKGSSLLNDAISKRANKLKLKPVGGVCEDSDSDMEDFRSVLEDSEMCLKVINHSLKKKHSNPMGTGLASHGKYVEMLATCETHISCVENVCSHLTQDDIGLSDVQRVQDLLCQWQTLYELAADRHQQTQQLATISKMVPAMKKVVEEIGHSLSRDLFASKEELEANITTLRLKGDKLAKQKDQLQEHGKVIQAFLQYHPSINVSKYVQELQALDTSTAQAQEKVHSRLESLENNWAVWCEYLEGQKELDALMAADRDRAFALLCRKETGQRVTPRAVLLELETLQNNLSVFESKLSVLQALRQRLTQVSDDHTQQAFLASIADMRNRIHVITQRCRDVHHFVEEEEMDGGRGDEEFGHLAMSAVTIQESYAVDSNLSRQRCYDTQAAIEAAAAAATNSTGTYLSARRHSPWSWLRTVPVQIVALMMLAGLIYVIDPDILSDLTSFSLTLTPDLRHINGPPPS